MLLGIAWGGLAFGAVYPWAYAPLLLCACLCAVWMGATAPDVLRRNTEVAIGLGVVASVVLLQLVPLRVSTLSMISPAFPALLQSYVLGFASPAPDARHPLSISPGATAVGLMFLVSFGALLLTLSAMLDRRAIATLVRGVAVIGAVMALVGIVQAPFYVGKIYGFWTPFAPEPLDAFGPFVNRNHFAGWMLMGLPLTFGYLMSRVHRRSGHLASGVRARIVWLSSAEASEVLLLATASLIMGLSVVLTRSRSGLIGLTIAVLLTAAWVARSSTGWRRSSSVAFSLFLLTFSVWWAGLGPTATRFGALSGGIVDRVGIWRDAWNIGLMFPLTGTGLNTYGIATLFYQTHSLRLHFAQAHNDYLQLFAEGGLLLCVPAAIAALLFARRVGSRLREDRETSSMIWIRRGAIAGLVAIATQEVGEFSLQMPGNAFLFVILSAVALARPEAGEMRAAAR